MQSEESFQVRIINIISEAEGVKTFELERTDGEKLSYKSGQFLTFLFSHPSPEIRRSYSFSSAAILDEPPAITIKRVPNGAISRYFINRLSIGDTLTATPAAGRFTLGKAFETTPKAKRLIFFGAGIGITPLFSLIKEALMTTEAHLILVLANRNNHEAIFAEALRKWEVRYSGRFSIIDMHSQPGVGWSGLRGRLSNARVENLIASLSLHEDENALFFLCGPKDWMRMIAYTLVFLDFKDDSIRRENFVVPPPATRILNTSAQTVLLEIGGRLTEVSVPANTSILEAALKAGLPMPYSCKAGQCGSCAALRKSGKLLMTANEVLTDREMEEGWVLTCTGYPLDSEVKLSIE